jgi:hypothetical protein
MTTFQHKPFITLGQEIRLLQLLDSSTEDQVSIKLTQLAEPSQVSYIAISYRWGDPSATKEIWINSLSYNVTESLYEALLRLQKYQGQIGKSGIYFWIDAICIDQNNLNEKSHEVSRMRTIYEDAEYVICWLGSSAEDSDLAISQISKVGQDLLARGYLDILDYEQWAVDILQCYRSEEAPRVLGYEESQSLQLGTQQGVDFTVPSMLAFTSRPYWHRVW